MHIKEHCARLNRLLMAWENRVHTELGYFPAEFRSICHAHVVTYLDSILEELEADASHVRDTLTQIRPVGEACPDLPKI